MLSEVEDKKDIEVIEKPETPKKKEKSKYYDDPFIIMLAGFISKEILGE